MSQFNPEIVEVVNNIMTQKFEVPAEKLVASSLLKEDLNLDSLDFVDMFVLLEQKFGKTPENIDFLKIKNLGDIYQLVSDFQAAEQKK